MGSDGEDYEISVEEVADGRCDHWSHSHVRPDNMSGKERARVPFCADEVANEVADEVVELELSEIVDEVGDKTDDIIVEDIAAGEMQGRAIRMASGRRRTMAVYFALASVFFRYQTDCLGNRSQAACAGCR